MEGGSRADKMRDRRQWQGHVSVKFLFFFFFRFSFFGSRNLRFNVCRPYLLPTSCLNKQQMSISLVNYWNQLSESWGFWKTVQWCLPVLSFQWAIISANLMSENTLTPLSTPCHSLKLLTDVYLKFAFSTLSNSPNFVLGFWATRRPFLLNMKGNIVTDGDQPSLFAILRFRKIPGTVSLEVKDCAIKFLEHVQIRVNLNFSRRGDLSLQLRAPSNTTSPMTQKRPGDNSKRFKNLTDLTITSLFHWEEDPTGKWELKFDGFDKRHRSSGDL